MALNQSDRIAFSLKIVSTDVEVKGIETAKAQLQAELTKSQKIDTANKNLFDPVNVFANSYQLELGLLDGNQRTITVEQNIQDAAKKKLQNYFFPNDLNASVPSLSALQNIWTQLPPFALNYALGKNYSEGYTVITKEGDHINTILSTITAATGTYSDYELTTGTELSGTCDLPSYTDKYSCVSHGGHWTTSTGSFTSPAIATFKTNMVNAANALITLLNNEILAITINDPNLTNQTNNNAAINNINNAILPALNTWLSYIDFEGTGSGPSKLHSIQLTALQTALTNRLSFIATRTGQLNTILGTISQDVSNGNILSSSGLYGKRYNYLDLRLNSIGGSLMKVVSLQAAISAQDSIKNNLLQTKSTYMSICPTSILKAPASGTATIHLADVSFLSTGDTVYITAEGQQELQRAIKSINGTVVILNDIIPAKYRPDQKARLYKDLT